MWGGGYSWKGWARDCDRILVNLQLQYSCGMMASVMQTLDRVGRDKMNLGNYFFFLYMKHFSLAELFSFNSCDSGQYFKCLFLFLSIIGKFI